MSRSAVRAAVYNYLRSPAVPGVDYVFPGIPFDQAGVAWDEIMVAGQTTRCFIVVVIEDADDYGNRIFVMDGAGGRRLVEYPVSLNIYFEDVGGDPLAALTAQEAMLDAVAARMRADPSIGADQNTTGILVAAAPHLKVNPGVLNRLGDGDPFVSWSTVDFPVSVYEYST